MSVPGASEVSDQLLPYHAARARGGVVLNITAVCSAEEATESKGFLSQR